MIRATSNRETWEKYQLEDYLRRLTSRWLRDPSEAGEAFAEAACAFFACRLPARMEQPEKYARTILRNAVRKWFRARGQQRQNETTGLPEDVLERLIGPASAESPDAETVRRERREATAVLIETVEACVMRLPPDERHVVAATLLRHQSMVDVSAELRTAYHRIRYLRDKGLVDLRALVNSARRASQTVERAYQVLRAHDVL